jgi:flavin reductase (DIM6/NTAB) family NADH-FMN oxidoreductase RutF
MLDLGEQLRLAMRHWPTGVTVVTTQYGEQRHGMTVNSFTSVSLEPAIVAVTLANITRTYALFRQSEILGITILDEAQADISDRFAGRIPEDGDRFSGLETFTLLTGAPMLVGGLAHIDCRLRAGHPLEQSTLYLLDVVAAQPTEKTRPLIYYNRGYHQLP